jgi:hypothetical protein
MVDVQKLCTRQAHQVPACVVDTTGALPAVQSNPAHGAAGEAAAGGPHQQLRDVGVPRCPLVEGQLRPHRDLVKGRPALDEENCYRGVAFGVQA